MTVSKICELSTYKIYSLPFINVFFIHSVVRIITLNCKYSINDLANVKTLTFERQPCV